MKEIHVHESGSNLISMVQTALVVLKLCGVIRWNWLAVLSPVLFSMAVFLFAVLVEIYCKTGDKNERG